MKKIDLHLHVRSVFQNEPGKPMISDASGMLAHMAELHIEKGVLMSGGETGSPFGNNEEIMTIVQKYPSKFSWMCNVDEGDPRNLYELLSYYKERGAIGIGELMINKRLDHPFLQALFTAAEKLNLPITIHMSPKEGYSYGVVDDPGLPLLENVLKTYPSLKILGHSPIFWNELHGDGRLLELFETYPNLYGDLSANSGGNAIMKNESFGLSFLERFSDRLFFATDMLTADTIYPLGDWLDKQASLGKLSRTAYKKICWENAKNIFGL